jgi:general secretion pathway protein G
MIEIILVIVIIMTLAAVVGPRVVGKSQKAKVNTTRIQMNQVKMALQQFEIHATRFPTTSEGLDALMKQPSGLNDDEWPDRYMDKMPKDSWKQPFEYKYPSDHGMDFDLISAGPDKKMGTDDDIANYDDQSN